MSTEDTARSEYVAGLRALADAIEAHPEILLPQGGQPYAPLTWVASHEGDPKDEVRKIVRALGGIWAKEEAGTDGKLFKFTNALTDGFSVEVLVKRDQVCRRVVTGTREVTKTVPVTTEDVTVTEDVIEWVCEPLLAEATR